VNWKFFFGQKNKNAVLKFQSDSDALHAYKRNFTVYKGVPLITHWKFPPSKSLEAKIKPGKQPHFEILFPNSTNNWTDNENDPNKSSSTVTITQTRPNNFLLSFGTIEEAIAAFYVIAENDMCSAALSSLRFGHEKVVEFENKGGGVISGRKGLPPQLIIRGVPLRAEESDIYQIFTKCHCSLDKIEFILAEGDFRGLVIVTLLEDQVRRVVKMLVSKRVFMWEEELSISWADQSKNIKARRQ